MVDYIDYNYCQWFEVCLEDLHLQRTYIMRFRGHKLNMHKTTILGARHRWFESLISVNTLKALCVCFSQWRLHDVLLVIEYFINYVTNCKDKNKTKGVSLSLLQHCAVNIIQIHHKSCVHHGTYIQVLWMSLPYLKPMHYHTHGTQCAWLWG